jgi:hypothetical protein
LFVDLPILRCRREIGREGFFPRQVEAILRCSPRLLRGFIICARGLGSTVATNPLGSFLFMPVSSQRCFRTIPLLLAAISWPAAAVADVVVVPVPSPYSYDSATLRQRNLRGSWGRYIGFIGHSVIEWPAVPAQLNAGNPGTIRCNGNTCWREGYVAPSLRGGTPAGSLRHYFSYQLDCRDQSFDRIGDVRLPGHYQRGWQPVLNDPVALAVARDWCPRINQLPKEP